jgi:hypothetical protein
VAGLVKGGAVPGGEVIRVQPVVTPNGAESWTVLDDAGEVVAPVEAFLAHLQALDRSPMTIRAYAFRRSVALSSCLGGALRRASQVPRGINTNAMTPSKARGPGSSSTLMADPATTPGRSRRSTAG